VLQTASHYVKSCLTQQQRQQFLSPEEAAALAQSEDFIHNCKMAQEIAQEFKLALDVNEPLTEQELKNIQRFNNNNISAKIAAVHDQCSQFKTAFHACESSGGASNSSGSSKANNTGNNNLFKINFNFASKQPSPASASSPSSFAATKQSAKATTECAQQYYPLHRCYTSIMFAEWIQQCHKKSNGKKSFSECFRERDASAAQAYYDIITLPEQLQEPVEQMMNNITSTRDESFIKSTKLTMDAVLSPCDKYYDNLEKCEKDKSRRNCKEEEYLYNACIKLQYCGKHVAECMKKGDKTMALCLESIEANQCFMFAKDNAKS